MIRRLLALSLCALALPAHSAEPAPAASGLNAHVLRAIDAMPEAGGYSTSGPAGRLLAESIQLAPRSLTIDAARAVPSFCSSATYLVFASVCQQLTRSGQLALEPEALRALLVTGQRDGEGIWGRWNANGPGTARLFHELDLGKNFTDWDDALPGDFMKIFWTSEVGKNERGHSVVFLGTEREKGVDYVHFWSSNKPGGYGAKRVPRKSVAQALFSRLERPENLARIPALPRRDAYLASLLTTRSSLAEMREKCGL